MNKLSKYKETSSTRPVLKFATPPKSYDELEAELNAYVAQPELYPHDVPSIESVRLAIVAGRSNNVGVGGLIMKDDKVILRAATTANAPYIRSDLHTEMMLLNDLEEQLKDEENPRMRDYTLFTSQEACPMCLVRICFAQVGKTYYVYRDAHSIEAGAQTNWERLPEAFQLLGERLVIEEAQCSPVVKEISRLVWLKSVAPAIDQFIDRY